MADDFGWMDGYGWMDMDGWMDGWSLVQVRLSLTFAGGLRPPDPPPGGLRPPGPPEVWPSYAPVWGLCADLLEK